MITALALLCLITASHPQSVLADPSAAAQGRQLYHRYCAQCHQADAIGIPGRFPPLIGSSWVTGHPEILIRILLNGLEGPIEVGGKHFDGVMPGGRDQLSDTEVAALATFIRQLGGNQAPAVTEATVDSVRLATREHRGRWTVGELRSGLGESWLFGIGILLLAVLVALWAMRSKRQD